MFSFLFSILKFHINCIAWRNKLLNNDMIQPENSYLEISVIGNAIRISSLQESETESEKVRLRKSKKMVTCNSSIWEFG